MSSGVPLGSEFQLEDVSTDQNSLGETSGRQASKAQQSASAPTARLSPDVEEHVRLMQAEKDAAIALCDARKAEFQKKLAEMSAEYGAQFDSIKATLQSFDVHHASEIAQLDHKHQDMEQRLHKASSVVAGINDVIERTTAAAAVAGGMVGGASGRGGRHGGGVNLLFAGGGGGGATGVLRN